MKNAIILHGMPDKDEYYDTQYPCMSNFHFLPWLQRQLQLNDWEAHTPEVKDAHDPTYDKWLKELNRYELNSNTVLVGHSCGAGFIVRYLSENPHTRVHKVFLVAPWLNTPGAGEYDTDMFEFDINPIASDCAKEIHLLLSTDDFDSIQSSSHLVMEGISGIHYHEFSDKGHFAKGDIGNELPELLELILS